MRAIGKGWFKRSMMTMLALAIVIPAYNAAPDTASKAYAATATATADFAVRADYPLIKSKFGVYNSPFVQPSRFARDLEKIKALRPARLRFEPAWGRTDSFFQPMVTGTATNLQYDYEEIDELFDMLNSNDIPPVLAASYTPGPLIPTGGTYISPPSNTTTWGHEVVNAFADHFTQTNRFVQLYEMWNEPDLNGIFFSGTQSDYHEIYKRGVEGVRAANPDAAVGGPALALSGWQGSFLNYVKDNNLPLDSFSYHLYGGPNDSKVTTMRNALSSDYRFSTTDTDITEYNYILNFSPSTPVIRYQAAAHLLDAFKQFLAKPWINHVDWAQMQEPDCNCDRIGLLDLDGHQRASYNAFKIYADMPVDRRQLTISGPVDGMASADAHKASLVLWNLSGSTQTVDVALNNIPFATGNFKVYRIDAAHASYTDDPSSEFLVPVEQYLNVSSSGVTWSGSIADETVVYLEFEDGTSLHELDTVKIGDVIKVNNYMPDRTKSSYSSIDPLRWTGYLGMGTEQWADAEVGIVAKNLPDKIHARFTVDGTLQNKDANSLLGLRVDYEVAGSYTKGVLYHGGLYNAGRSAPMPWGTKLQADQVIQVADLQGFDVELAANAPANWNGKATITLIMQNAGEGTRAKVELSPVSLRAWYKLDASSGSTVADSSGYGNSGTVSGAAWAAGKFGSGLTFNGSTSYAQLPRTIGDEFTVAFWMKTTQTGGNGCSSWYCGTGLVDGEVAGVTNDFGITLHGSKVAFGVGNPDTTIVSGSNVNDGQWHHVAVTRTKSSGAIKLYVDGKLEASGTGGTQSLTSPSGIRLGSLLTALNYYSGSLDHVRLYEGVLPASRVQSLYAEGK